MGLAACPPGSWAGPGSHRSGVRPVPGTGPGQALDRDLCNAELRSGLLDERGREAQPEPGRETAALVEEEGPAMRSAEVEGPPGEQHDLRGLRMVQRPGDLRLAAAVDEQQVA